MNQENGNWLKISMGELIGKVALVNINEKDAKWSSDEDCKDKVVAVLKRNE